MTDLSLAQHRSARCGFTSSAISTNYAALVIGRGGSIHSGFGRTIPQGALGRARRTSGLVRCPRARKPRQRPPNLLPHPLPYPGIAPEASTLLGFLVLWR